MRQSQEEINRKQRERRSLNKNEATHTYEKTLDGFLVRLYRNMESRISGIQSAKHHLYAGKDLLARQDFYDWARQGTKLFIMFRRWKDSGFNMKLTPTVDRIDSSLGYSTPNMEWVTHSENSRRGAVSLCRKSL